MPVKSYHPTTAGRRLATVDAFEEVTKQAPEKSLTFSRARTGGRSHGKISVRHRGGGAKRLIRMVDFKGDKLDIPGSVRAIEYDPHRGARLALVEYPDGERRYMIAPLGLSVGATVRSSQSRIEPQTGNRMPLGLIPVGTAVHAIEMMPGSGAALVRGAGSAAQLLAVEGSYAQLRLPSGEVRAFLKECRATVGQVGNADRRLIRWGKAGRMRHRGRRPEVRGKAMNPVDHPHGGGEGHNPIGLVHPKTPQGLPAFGVKTRKKKKWSNKFILQRRK